MDNTVVVVTPQYGTVVTDIGSAKITAASFEGRKVNITHAAVGDGGGAYYKPTTEQTKLKNECWRGEIAWAKVSETTPNMYDVKIIVPADIGGFTVREAAIIDEDGDTIAIWNTPAAEKVAITDGVSFPLTMMAHIVVTDASAVDFSINPALDTVNLEDLEAAFAAHNADLDAHADLRKMITELGCATSIVTLVIPADGWEETDDPVDGCGYVCAVAVEGVTASHWPVGGPDWSSAAVARKAGFAGGCDTEDGYIQFYAKNIPEADVTATIALIGAGTGVTGGAGTIPVASSNTLGVVKVPPNSGLTIDDEGNLAVDMSSEDEAKSAINEAFEDKA